MSRGASSYGIQLINITSDAEELASSLIDLGAVPREAVVDAAHIATAASNGIDYLVTWNFRPIANATMRSKTEDVCRSAGFDPPAICTPIELMELNDVEESD